MWEAASASALVKRELESMGIERRDVASPDVVGFIGTGRSPAVLLELTWTRSVGARGKRASFFPAR